MLLSSRFLVRVTPEFPHLDSGVKYEAYPQACLGRRRYPFVVSRGLHRRLELVCRASEQGSPGPRGASLRSGRAEPVRLHQLPSGPCPGRYDLPVPDRSAGAAPGPDALGSRESRHRGSPGLGRIRSDQHRSARRPWRHTRGLRLEQRARRHEPWNARRRLECRWRLRNGQFRWRRTFRQCAGKGQ